MINRELIESLIRDIPDFPHEGILFKDITPLLGDAAGFAEVISALATLAEGADLIAGVEARGFVLGAAVAAQVKRGFIPIRKSGKLPAKSISESYSLEYGSNTLEIHEDAIAQGARVMLIDDVLATGGTLIAAARLIERAGGELHSIVTLMEIAGLSGRAKFSAAYPHKSISILI